MTEKESEKQYTVKSTVFKFVVAGLCLAMTVISSIFLNEMPKLVRIVALIFFLLLGVVLSSTDADKHKALFRFAVIMLIVGIFVLVISIIFDRTNVLNKFTDTATLIAFIRSTGFLGVFLYIILIVFNIVFLPLPTAVPAFIGSKLFGPVFAFIYMSIGTIIGSIITFMLGKIFGQKLVSWIIGQEKTEKYAKLLNEKGRVVFIAMMLFPFFPDDIICLVAGMTAMSYKYFITVISITRPLVVGATCFLFDGKLIPFKGWGIPVWISLFALCVVLFFVFRRTKNYMSQRLLERRQFKIKTVNGKKKLSEEKRKAENIDK